ncbi:glutamate ABC transporter substrate-binding protein [Phytohabitans suffuscus]|uniref:glutamate ABC transporter substrate-binding protein n=1 Tax=Phytohabitans suffuscus TaxID=624315 RepID=UPI0018D7FC85|nr:glutamate ABC transporter substrate-binding protein [Phytohabitans suffuscus]
MSAVLLLSGCTADLADRGSGGARAEAPLPQGVRDPAVPPSAAPAEPDCDPRASLRPAGALPRPGSMPPGSTMDKIRQRGRLVAGVDQNNYLFGFRDPVSGRLEGFDIDLVREVARAIFGDPERVQYVVVTQAQRLTAVNGQVDLVANSMTITCGRRELVEFSTNYLDSGQRVLVPQTSPVGSIDDLGGRRVCAAADTTSIQAIIDAPSKPVAVSAVDWTDCLVLLQQGQVDAISTTDNVLAGLAAQDPTTKIVGPRFSDEPHGLAFARGATDLVRFVNGVFDRLRADGGWMRIYNRWLGATLGRVTAPPPARYRA